MTKKIHVKDGNAVEGDVSPALDLLLEELFYLYDRAFKHYFETKDDDAKQKVHQLEEALAFLTQLANGNLVLVPRSELNALRLTLGDLAESHYTRMEERQLDEEFEGAARDEGAYDAYTKAWELVEDVRGRALDPESQL